MNKKNNPPPDLPSTPPTPSTPTPSPLTTSGSNSMTSSSSLGRKIALKEKIVQMYDLILRGEDPDKFGPGGESGRFWSEFFLLRPKISILESEVSKLSTDTLASPNLRRNINTLFEECVINLGEDHHIKVVYALQTLCGLVRSIMKKYSNGSGFDLVNMLIGFENAEDRMISLMAHLNDFLVGEEPASLKDLCLKLLLVMATGIDNVSQNTLMEYVMMNSVFESIIHLLSNSEIRANHGHSAVLLLTILVQYRKYESANPYVVKLSILDQELALHGYGQVITGSLVSYTQAYEASFSDQSNSGWLSSFTSLVGNMFVSDEGSPRIEQMKARNSVLLALYEAIHLNRNFIATLAHYQTENPSPQLNSSLSTKPVGVKNTVHTNLASTPSNLLVTFLEYCSIIMQDTKTESSQNTVKLSFLILLCVTEDQYANALMHDPNLVFRVKLHKVPMRHRKQNVQAEVETNAKSLACAVMDLMIEFVRSHLLKRFPLELYMNSLGVIHRLLSYQKRSRVRLNYPWKELWTALIGLLKFVASNENNLIKKINVFGVCLQVIVIFNLFVTYGDTFLPSPNSYDELYYEMVRCHQTFDSLYAMALRYSSTSGDHKESAVKLTNALVNIRAITAHFNPKIEAWLSSQQLSTPTESQILEVVKSNYDSLTLKLQDGLDQYDHYVESPKHSGFFTSLVRNVIGDTRQHVVLNDLELQAVLQEFSTIQ